MPSHPNTIRWQGAPGHYEVYYLTFTDPASGVGVWIRYTMLAPDAAPDAAPGTAPGAALGNVAARGPSEEPSGRAPSASLWFLTMDPAGGTFARKSTVGIDQLSSRTDPFELRIGESVLTDTGMRGGVGDAEWELRWRPGRAYEHVHPLLRGVASTILVLPHADVEIDGRIRFAGRELTISGARGGQAHLWGSKHAKRWAWVHCNDFADEHGEPAGDTFIDGVSVIVSRFGRDIGPNTPVVGRIDGEDFRSVSPPRVLSNDSKFELTRWRFEAVDGRRKLICEVEADHDQLAGVTYTDPDGEHAYCYNGETASMRMQVLERAGRFGGFRHAKTLVAPGRAHFEYAQREPLPGTELLL